MWNKFKNHLKEFFRIFKLEFKTNFGGHRLKMLKFLGVLVVPFLYGFIYIYAMWNPIANTKASDMAIVASKKMAQDDEVYKALMKKVDYLNKTSKTVHLNKTTIAANDLYSQDRAFKDEIGSHNVSIVIQPIHEIILNQQSKDVVNLTQYIGGVLAHTLNDLHKIPGADLAIIKMRSSTNNVANLETFKKIIGTALVANALYNSVEKYTAPFKIYFNYKKNFVLGFGANDKILGSETIMKIVKSALCSNQPHDKKMVDAIMAETHRKYEALNKNSNKSNLWLKADVKLASQLVKNVVSQELDAFDPRIIKNDFEGKGAIEQYGFGLAPLFICVGLWIGALSTTLMVTPKVHERGASKTKTFFAKLSLIWIANIMQGTILLGALTGIGFHSLGSGLPLFFLTGYIVAMLFSTMVFAIRCSVPTKITGIILVTFFFVFQVTASGGLFPMYTQKGFFKILHPVMPFTYSINMFRQTLINTVPVDWGMNLLVLILLTIPFAILGPMIYARRKNKLEKTNPKAFTEIDEEKQNEILEIESALSDRVKEFVSKHKKTPNNKSKKQSKKKASNAKEVK